MALYENLVNHIYERASFQLSDYQKKVFLVQKL